MSEDDIETLKEMVEQEFCHSDVGECTNSGMLEFICKYAYHCGVIDGHTEGYILGLQDGSADVLRTIGEEV